MFRQYYFNYDTFHLIIIVLTLIPNGQGQNSSSAPWESLPDMDIFCPGADVCRRHSSGPKHNFTFREGYTSCCRECSCAATCGSTRNCCFPTQDAYPIGQVDRNRQQCVVPSTIIVSHKLNAYYMVAASPPSGCKVNAYLNVANEKQLLNDACGEQTVAPWGSLQPVYSKRTGLIYKNTRCAKCHGISDGIVWTSILFCDRYDEDTAREWSMSSFMQYLENTMNTSQSHCAVYFAYPGVSTDIEKEICFVNVTNSCNGTNFKISDVNITHAEVIKACESGLFSPYRENAKSVYANVFCSICNREVFKKDMMCSPTAGNWNPQYWRGPGTGYFVTLLDSKYIESIEKAEKAYIESPVVCRIEGISVNRNNCRSLQCPTGQFRFQDGTCEYPSDMWFDQTIAIYIQLFPEAQIQESSFKGNLFNDNQKVYKPDPNNQNILYPYLKSRWPKKWRIDQLLYVLNSDASTINQFVVMMAYNLLNKSPKHIIKSMKQHIPVLWTITLNDSVIDLVPKVAEYKELIYKGRHNMVPLWALEKKLESSQQFLLKNMTVPNLKPVFIINTFLEYTMITKTFFCQQVQLKSNEFVFYSNNAIMYYKEIDTFLSDGEFEIVYDDEGNYVARICLYDTRFKEITRVSSANTYGIAKGRIRYALTVCLLIALRWFIDAIG